MIMILLLQKKDERLSVLSKNFDEFEASLDESFNKTLINSKNSTVDTSTNKTTSSTSQTSTQPTTTTTTTTTTTSQPNNKESELTHLEDLIKNLETNKKDK